MNIHKPATVEVLKTVLENYVVSEPIPINLSLKRLLEDPFLALATLLPWIRTKRWFMDKEATITGLEKADTVILVPGPDPAIYGLFVAFRLGGALAGCQKRYFIPIILSSFPIPDVPAMETVRLELTDGTLYWSLAEHSSLYQESWLQHLAVGDLLLTQRGGCIRFQPLSALPIGDLQARCLNVSTSNVLTLVDVKGENTTLQWISKTYKDLRGPSGQPDRQWPANYEAVRYEALTQAGYPNIPPLHGLVFYADPTGSVSALGAVMDAVDREDEVGAVFWNALGRYLEAWQSDTAQDDSFHSRYLQGAATAAREIAKTIAGMHAAFLASHSTSFRPTAASTDDLQGWSAAPLLSLEAALPVLQKRLALNAEGGLEPLIQKLERLLPPAKGYQETDLELAGRVLREHGQGLMKIQIHGDLSTAQGLITAGPSGRGLDRFLEAIDRGSVAAVQEAACDLADRIRWIDFEGVPAKTLVDSAEDGRDSPFLDLAGIAQGFWYIANLQCYGYLGLNPQENPGHRAATRCASLALAGEITPTEAAVPGLTAALIRLIDGWFTAVTTGFLDGYLDDIESRGLSESLLTPWDRSRARAFVHFWMLSRAAHELRYETYARDWGWEVIPGGRILQILRTQNFAAALAKTGDFVQVEMPTQAFFSPVDATRLVDGIFLPLHHIRACDDWGIGDFATARKAVDFSQAMGFHFMQLLPVTYSAAFHSPYSVASSRALDPEYASVESLLDYLEPYGVTVPAADFILEHQADIESLRRSDWIDHEQINQLKLEALRRIWEVFRRQPDSEPYRDFQIFLERSRDWLPDHMLYLELKQEFMKRDPAVGWDWRTWNRFEPGLSDREPLALERVRRRHADNVLFDSFVQFVLDRQFRELVDYGRQKKVFLMVDMPFSPPDAEVWINPALVGLKKENRYQRCVTQGVPAKKENPVGQNWQFTAYEWSNSATIEFFLDLFRISQERAVYVRVDHVLGIYRTYLFWQDVDEHLTLEKLGLYEPVRAIRERALQENTGEAKTLAVQEVTELFARKLADPAAGLPQDVIQALFDETGSVRRGGNMITIARKVSPEKYDEQLPVNSLWQRWTQAEDLIFRNQPVWDYIRLSPNERAKDEGFLKQYLFPEDGTLPPLPTDDLRPAYYCLAPAEKMLAEMLRLAQEQGTILILETLGNVPEEIENSTRRLGGYNYIPVIWGLERSGRYHPTHFIRNAYATFGVADSESLYAAWQNAPPDVKWTLLRDFFPGVADHELEQHAVSLTPEVHEKLLLMVYAPPEIYPELAPDTVPLMAMTGLHDIAGYSDDYRLNRPGESGQWSIRFPEEVSIDNLLASARNDVSTEKAGQVVELFQHLQAARQRQTVPVAPESVKLLRVRPDVQRMVMQIREIGENPNKVKPFYIEASVQGQPASIELVVTDSAGRENTFIMQPVHFRSGGVPGVTWWGAAIIPRRVGNYTFRIEITRTGGGNETSKKGYLFAVPEGVDLNPLSPDYFLRDDLSAIQIGVYKMPSNNLHEEDIEFQKLLDITRQLKDSVEKADAFVKLGNWFRDKTDEQGAIEMFHQARITLQQIDNCPRKGELCNDLGMAYRDLGHPTLAIECINQALVIAREISNPHIECHALLYLAIAYRNRLGDKTIDFCLEALEIARLIGDPLVVCKALGILSLAYWDRGKAIESITCSYESLVIAKDYRYLYEQATAWDRLGVAHREWEGNKGPEKSIEYHKRALAIAEEINNPKLRARVLDNLGLDHRTLGKLDCAIKFYLEAKTIADDLPTSRIARVLGRVLDHLSEAYRQLGKPKEAIEYAKQALPIAKKFDDQLAQGIVLGDLGLAYQELGKPKEAIINHEEHLKICQKINDRWGEAAAFDHLGTAHADLGQFNIAITRHKQALSVAGEIYKRQIEADALNHLGAVYAELGQMPKAIEYEKRACAIAEEIHDARLKSYVLDHLGVAHRKSSDYNSAKKFHEQALEVAETCQDQRIKAYVLDHLGASLSKLGHHDLAIKYHNAALNILNSMFDPRGRSRILDHLGVTYRESGNFQFALDYHDQALKILITIDNPVRKGKTLFNKALAYEQIGNRAQAITIAQEAFRVYKSIEGPGRDQVRSQLEEWKARTE